MDDLSMYGSNSCPLTADRRSFTLGAVKKRAPKPPSESAFNEMIIRRVALIRELSGLTQDQMARRLGIETPRFSKWEQTTPMPPHFWQAFCHHAGVDWTKMLAPDPQRKSDPETDV